MTPRHRRHLDLTALTLASLGLLVLAGVMVVELTPTYVPPEQPTGPRLEVTGTYTVPRSVTVLPAPNAIIGDLCYPRDAVGVSVAGPVVCRVMRADELRWVISG